MMPLVFQTDFGLVDGAVSAMYGVAYTVNPMLKIHDLTHDITPYNIWEASYRLIQTINYWPEGTVFVLGDNRGHSLDSRELSRTTEYENGCIPLKHVVGKVLYRVSPDATSVEYKE